ncbi:MAG: dihydrofolate reductase [Bacteroidota bacterium]|nr:dihydrofolate reductase [Bacteroidota bacterium]
MLSHIVAASENNVIGSKNELPWKLASDFAYFKNKTWGFPVIMGRKTFDSLQKELPGRITIVITSKTNWHPENIIVVNTIAVAIEKAKESDAKDIFIIGGGEIFKQTMDIVDRIYRTRVHANVEGDAYYPEIDKSKWELTSSQSFPADEKNNYAYTFEVWDRIQTES